MFLKMRFVKYRLLISTYISIYLCYTKMTCIEKHTKNVFVNLCEWGKLNSVWKQHIRTSSFTEFISSRSSRRQRQDVSWFSDFVPESSWNLTAVQKFGTFLSTTQSKVHTIRANNAAAAVRPITIIFQSLSSCGGEVGLWDVRWSAAAVKEIKIFTCAEKK